MSLREIRMSAGQVLVAGFSGAGVAGAGANATSAPAELVNACARGELGGIVLFKRNLGAVHDIVALIRRFTSAAPSELPLLVAVDQEGGRVARLGPPVLKLPAMRRLAALDDPDLTRRAGEMLGRQLRALGFTMNLAPVLDVDTNPQNPVIGDRSFGVTPAQVIRHGLAFARGLGAQGGVLSCGKHFPGHGDTDLDSHLALPRLRHDRARLDAVELAPFRAAVGVLPAIMTAHVIFDALPEARLPAVPATLSARVVTELLRGELDFQGLVLSDDLEMKAIADHFGIAEAATGAIAAGCDMLLVCSDLGQLFAAHAALVARAEADTSFRARLHEAAARSIATRATCPPGAMDDLAACEAFLRNDAAAAFARELEECLARLP